MQSRAIKKQISWASKGSPQPITNPIRLGQAYAAGRDGFDSPEEFLAARRPGRTTVTAVRRAKIIQHRLSNRSRGYRTAA